MAIRALDPQFDFASDIADVANDSRRTKTVVEPTWDGVSQYDPGGVKVDDIATSVIRYLILADGDSLQILYGKGEEDTVEY